MKLFKNISDCSEIFKYFEKVHINKKTILFYEKQPTQYFYYLIKGKVTLYSNIANGKKKIFLTLDSDSIINDFDQAYYNFPYEAIAFEDCEILKISQDHLFSLFKLYPQLELNALKLQSHRTRRLYRLLKNSISINVEKKIAAKLWKFAKDYGIKSDDEYTLINFKINNSYLADVIGVSRETVSRAITSLVELGLVKIIANNYYVKQDLLLDYYRNIKTNK
ncbi:Crp/Fnr family transcriptional regulator [Mycoplasma sp. P36-A1]|uniref:Crp/Fnr family transcriptional regulator n=1 Tax=Mycoplasma sp. P36-A1 TaxID=3252900 RepID=UPI003C2DBF2C